MAVPLGQASTVDGASRPGPTGGRSKKVQAVNADPSVDLWALDEVHFQQYGSRCRQWVPPEDRDPILLHPPTRQSVGYFGAVRLRGRPVCLRARDRSIERAKLLGFSEAPSGAEPTGRPTRRGHKRQRQVSSCENAQSMEGGPRAGLYAGLPSPVPSRFESDRACLETDAQALSS